MAFSRIEFEGKIMTQKKGFAELPYLNASVMLDPYKNVSLDIIAGEYEEISLNHPLVPSRGVIYRDQDPATVPYVIDPRSLDRFVVSCCPGRKYGAFYPEGYPRAQACMSILFSIMLPVRF